MTDPQLRAMAERIGRLGPVRLRILLGLLREDALDSENWKGRFVAEISPPTRVSTAAWRSPREVRLDGDASGV